MALVPVGSAPVFSAMWYTSGTVIRTGQHDCAYERWLGYHAGRHGTGYRRKATAVPLATGSAVHKGLQLVGEWLMEGQRKINTHRGVLSVPDEVIAWAAIEAAAGYERIARARGLELTKTDVAAFAAVEQLILEQRTLIEALIWIYALVRLPYMLSRCWLIDVEFEETPVVDCTCGLGDWVGSSEQHAARQCTGIVAMGKADFLWETIADGMIEYEEFKTKAMPNYGWEQQWETSRQLFLNMEAASRRIGKDVSQAYVPTLFKGKRDRWDRDDKSAPKVQQSPLVYGWFDPGNGMNRPAEWAARFKWYDDWGKGHTLPRTFKRVPIWDEQFALPAENPNNVTLYPQHMSRVAQWVKGWILPIQYPELLKVFGPFPKPRALVPAYAQSLLTSERQWRQDVDDLRRVGIFQPSDVAATNIGPETAADIIPRSWQCVRFDGTPCAFKPICHREPGWENLETIGHYEIRRPHHGPERVEREAAGIVFPAEGDEDDDGADA